MQFSRVTKYEPIINKQSPDLHRRTRDEPTVELIGHLMGKAQRHKLSVSNEVARSD